MEALIQIRKAQLYVSTEKAALMVGRSVRWVRDNKQKFVFKRKNNCRNLEYELSSVLKVWQDLNGESIVKHQVAS